MDKELEAIKAQIHEWTSLGLIAPEDIPSIELYMDQVTTFMDSKLAKNKRREDDKALTKTMINNYTKNDILPPPNKKKYSKNHIILLAYIYYLKSFLSISDIKVLLAPMIEKYYDAADTAELNFLSIYSDIFELEQKEHALLEDKLLASYHLAQGTYSSEEESYLHKLAFISLLSYDIYAKKQLIEAMIDNMKKEQEEAANASKSEKKAEKAEKKKKSKTDEKKEA